MKIKYLGTAAAEGIPGMFCNCEICENARKKSGKEIRTRSQALLDDKVLIDFPADTYMHILNNNIKIDNIHTLIITHSHSDHFYADDFWCRNPGIANNIDEKPLNVYVTNNGYNAAVDFTQKENVDSNRIKLHKINVFETFCADGYRFIPVMADHNPKTDPVIYIIEKDDKTLLYAHDTGYFPEETWNFLSKYNRKFDFVSLDCTCAFIEGYRVGHMSLSSCCEVFERLKEIGICDGKTTVCLNHFSHNGLATHTELEKKAEKYGFITSYDGLEVEF